MAWLGLADCGSVPEPTKSFHGFRRSVAEYILIENYYFSLCSFSILQRLKLIPFVSHYETGQMSKTFNVKSPNLLSTANSITAFGETRSSSMKWPHNEDSIAGCDEDH